MVVVHLAVAARPTEVCELRIENIDRQSDEIWSVRVPEHKMDNMEDAPPKIFYLAKPEIETLLPIIGERTEGYIFRPIDAIPLHRFRFRHNPAVPDQTLLL